MAEPPVPRRLAAILAADVVGYSRLMAADEEGTLAKVKVLQHEIWDPRIQDHRGRVVKRMGDGILLEFGSAVDAVRCAIKMQEEMAKHNEGVSADQRIEIRIGIHVGDVIVEDEDIFGDGVNIAARLEGIAQPGSVSISEDAFRQVQGKVSGTFVDQGEHHLKNIPRPVRVYHLEFNREHTTRPATPILEASSQSDAQNTLRSQPLRRWRIGLLFAGTAIVAALLIAAVFLSQSYRRTEPIAGLRQLGWNMGSVGGENQFEVVSPMLPPDGGVRRLLYAHPRTFPVTFSKCERPGWASLFKEHRGLKKNRNYGRPIYRPFRT